MKLLEQLETVARRRGLAKNTIDAYSLSVRQFLSFTAAQRGEWTHPKILGTADVEAFLNDLVIRRRLSGSSQNQALNALVFLYQQVLEDTIPQDHLGKFLLQRSSCPVRVPTVLSVDEVQRVISAMASGHISRLMVELMYGTGMRVGEVCTLRVRDIDLGRAQIIVRAGKGDKDRVVMLPQTLRGRLAEQSRRVRTQHEQDLSHEGGFVPIHDSLAHKAPYAQCDWRWQFVFPSVTLRRDPHGRGFRWHAHPAVLDRMIRRRSSVMRGYSRAPQPRSDPSLAHRPRNRMLPSTANHEQNCKG